MGFKLKNNTSADSGFLTSSAVMGTLEMPSENVDRNGFRQIKLEISRYAQNPKALAIQAYTLVEYAGGTFPEPYGKLSVNVLGLRLEPWEVAIKDWSENEQLAKLALSSKFFDPSTRYDSQEGVTVASINPGLLPVTTLRECARHFKWKITPMQLIESLARDCHTRGDKRNINLILNSGKRNILVNPLIEGGIEMILFKKEDSSRVVLDYHDAAFAEDDLITGQFSLYIGYDILAMAYPDLSEEKYQEMLLSILDIYISNFSQENQENYEHSDFFEKV